VNLERPVWSAQALEWRLRGLVGIAPLADKYLKEFTDADRRSDEKLLTLADFLIVLREVDYHESAESLSKREFDQVYRTFVRELVDTLNQGVNAHREKVSSDLLGFWNRVVQKCQA
jgi:hypothetical protein